MRRLNSPDQAGVLHYLTLNVRDRKAAFRRDEYAQSLADLLRFECDRHPATLAAFVIMPNHLHALINVEGGELSRFLKRFKANATRNLDALMEQNGRERERVWLHEKGRRELWQDGKHSLHVYSPRWIEQKIRYIHNNPVVNGLVACPREFLWSSLGAYEPQSGHIPPIRIDVAELY